MICQITTLYLESGVDVIGKGKAFGQKLQDEYTTNDYHKPSDEYDPTTWTMEGAVSELKLLRCRQFATGG